jgi:2-amino-4-hydroxy-6-hydroxymethyldihydropteridine diphosphokinase
VILIAVGSNLPGPHGSPRANCEAALAALAVEGVRVLQRSRWYRTPPWPESEIGRQPWYVNGVVAVETALAPEALLAAMHRVEAAMGRVRGPDTLNAARPIDLDLVDYHGQVRDAVAPILPHPRLDQRAFVLRPLSDVAPDWVHPVSGASLSSLLRGLPADAVAEPIDKPE